MHEVASGLAEHAKNRRPTRLVIPVNGQVFVLAHENPEFADVVLRAEDVMLDGFSVYKAMRLLGRNGASHVPGVDLMMNLCRAANVYGSRVLLLGGRPGAAERMQTLLKTECPALTVGTSFPPFGFERTAEGIAQVEREVRDFNPEIVFVALGAPKQEYLMDRTIRGLNVPVAMAVGGSFEMLSGMVVRAPLWVQKIGMEWFFRMVLEPRRLLWRYVYTNTVFLWVLLRELLDPKTATPQRSM